MSELKITNNNTLLITSLAASVGLHLLGLYILSTHPMIFHYSLRSLFGLSTASPRYLETQIEESVAEKNKTLQDIFEHILVLSPHIQQPFDLVALQPGAAISPDKEAQEPFAPLSMEEEILPLVQQGWVSSGLRLEDCKEEVHRQELLKSERSIPLSFPFALALDTTVDVHAIAQKALPQEDSLYIIDPVAAEKAPYSPVIESEANISLITEQLRSHAFLQNTIANAPEEKQVELDTSLGVDKLREAVSFLPLPPATTYGTPQLSLAPLEGAIDSYLSATLETTAEWNEDFDIDVSFLPHPQGKGYIFSLSLKPNFDISQYSLKHDIVFIIDRTARKARFEVFKRAVTKALASMQQGDSFNIYIVDKKLTRFNATSVSVNAKSIRAAEQFLEQHTQEMSFSQGDIYASLEKILPEIAVTDSVHSAILITDGATHFSTRKQQQLLKNWVEKNNGAVSIYTAAVGQKNDLLMLDLLSSISGGKLLWSDTHAAFPRKLAKLVLDLKDPVATDLVIEAVPLHADTHITLMHSSFPLPALFSHRPYVILGSIDNPGPFDLVIQGRHREEWIAIRKKVSFMEGTKADQALHDQWTAEKAQLSYAKFLNDGKPAHLKEAREILKKSRAEVAFEE